jgi:hypothetical protein
VKQKELRGKNSEFMTFNFCGIVASWQPLVAGETYCSLLGENINSFPCSVCVWAFCNYCARDQSANLSVTNWMSRLRERDAVREQLQMKQQPWPTSSSSSVRSVRWKWMEMVGGCSDWKVKQENESAAIVHQG